MHHCKTNPLLKSTCVNRVWVTNKVTGSLAAIHRPGHWATTVKWSIDVWSSHAKIFPQFSFGLYTNIAAKQTTHSLVILLYCLLTARFIALHHYSMLERLYKGGKESLVIQINDSSWWSGKYQHLVKSSHGLNAVTRASAEVRVVLLIHHGRMIFPLCPTFCSDSVCACRVQWKCQGTRDWGNLFVISRVRCIEVLFHTFYCNFGRAGE